MSAASKPGPDQPARPAQPSGCGDALSDDLGWALGVLFRAYAKAAHSAFADVPGGPRGYQVLTAVGRARPRSQLELASHLGVDRTVMTYLLDDLERAGLIERQPDPADRRARRIAATVAGRELACGLTRRLRTAEDHLLAGLDGEPDRATFRALLQRLATQVNTLDPVRNTCDVVRETGVAEPQPAG
jgi:DNA-binding MarR family transcriptional regulator